MAAERFLLVAFLVVAIIAYEFYRDHEVDELRPIFGNERWTCAPLTKGEPQTRHVGWVSTNWGLRIVVASRTALSYVKLSCRDFDGRGECRIINKTGWQDVETVVPPGAPIVFNRRSFGVDANWILNAPLSGELAQRIVGAFATGTTATITVKDIEGRAAYIQTVDLKGFNDAMAACGF